MSEHYDFHYQPTGSGAISGQQVLEQTEDAINELGDYVNANVGGAMDVAQQALETAQNAEQDAQTALDTANSFSSAIQSAQQDASTALSTAQTAQTTASNANNTAIQAQQDASSAVTTANNASSQVSTLSGTVTALGQRVTTAEGNIGQNTSDITALTTRVGTAEGNITTLQNDVSIAQGNASSAMATAGQVKQQAFVFRYSSTALVASSTNSNTLLDNTDNLKVGDKVIDSSGVLFSITAIDTQNSTFTIGTTLIDLAQDSDVVHKSGNETVAGLKTFENICLSNSIKAINLENQTIDLNNCYSSFGLPQSGNISFYFCNTNNGTANISNLPEQSAFFLISQSIRIISGGSVVYVKQTLVNSSGKTFVRYCNNSVWDSWQNVTNPVTTDTNQTISGNKTFSDNLTIYNPDDTVTPKGLAIRNAQWGVGESGGITASNINFLDKNSAVPVSIIASKGSSGQSFLRFSVRTKDSQNNTYAEEIYYDIDTSGNVEFRSWHDNIISLGTSAYKWKDVQTNKINSLEPSSLSLPSGNASDVIDISSYITDLSGNVNNYTAPANGWISIAVIGSFIAIVSSSWSDSRLRASSGNVRMLYPVLKNETLNISITGTTLAYARFIPCQGNV